MSAPPTSGGDADESPWETGGFFISAVDAAASDLTARITITLPRSLLAAVDAAGSNRSATIARIVAEWMATRSKK